MKKLINSLIAVAVLAAPLSVGAATDPLRKFAIYGQGISTTTLDASSSSFTVKLDAPSANGIWGLMIAWVTTVDADNGVSAITMSCTGSPDGGTTDYTLQSCATASGVCTSSDASWVKNPGANTTRWPWRVDIEGFPEIECTFTDTGGDSSDSVAVYITFATKG